jgi:hypothetical protein
MPVACQRNFSASRLSPVTPEGAWASPTPTYTLGPGCPYPVARDITFNVNGSPVNGATCGGVNRFLELGYGASAPDEVFLLRVATPGLMTFSLCGGADFDTVLYLRTQCDVPGTTLDYDDDGCGALQSRLSLDLPAGTYYLILDGYNSATDCGNYSLSVQRSENTATPTPTRTPTPTPP